MKRYLFLLFFFTGILQAQFQINGVVKDASTNKPLSFATITSSEGSAISDVDGKFTLQTKQNISSFITSYVGYNSTNSIVEPNKKFYSVFLSPQPDNLNEVIISGNPAVALIKKVIQRKDQNNPQKKLKSFQFKAYNKLIVSANPDSIKGAIDSVFTHKFGRKQFTKIDSSDYQFKKIISKQHLFQTEKVSQFQFNESGLKETVLGTKMAGFKQPVYELLAFDLQSFSIYDSRFELFETKYNSPIASDAVTHYNFKLLDTVVIAGRSTFMIHFKNKKKRNAAGLEGILYIDQENFAIAKAITRIKGVLDITGVNEFLYLEKEDLWFPITKNFKIVKGKNDDDIKILGGTIQFEADTEDFKSREKVASDFTYLLSETNYSEIVYNVPVNIKKSFIAVDVKDDAATKNETFWYTYRKDSLDLRSQKTYEVLDSISVKKRIETRLRLGRKIINGYLPIGFFDVDLRYLLSYNNYEGFRLGFGGITSEKFSQKYRIEGYTAYGTKDGNFKYNLGGAARVGKFSNTWIGAAYTDDVREIASTVFTIDKRVFKIYDPRPINVSTFYNHVTWRAYIETKIIPKTESIWQLTQSRIEPKFNYAFNVDGKLYSVFNMTTAMVSLQWSPFSDYMQTPTGRLEIEKRFPKFTFQFTQSLPNVLGNDFTFGKIDLRADYEKKYLDGQKTALLMSAGYAFGDAPLTHLYNTSPNSLTKDRVIQRITLAGKNSFETMYFNEFFSSQYIFLQLKHGSKRVTLFKKVKPSLVLVTRMAWGNMEKPEQHVGIVYKTLNKGFFESGIELNQIYSGFGLSGFYRYGPYQLARFEDNLSIKLSFVLDLGL
ncbi:DUF5686 family protein [Flavobacterium sp. GT3R68]|uniref:DUF5686 family protein n=1 Tax=Flavobacterium sp. GT3R68 TaxID=2594437 RepID=UPI000F863D37|nr:DUF5686 family protein [Flavobacterium sp. GT3R68]RTY91315.1 carboxypeptidase-like regulatory domain-containing protein [Flavobacterium sp. GSN2]TRW93941.1 carboxypeptidase-like regulatory domain-containing protein [Flavobacterium sp. GT3R68]